MSVIKCPGCGSIYDTNDFNICPSCEGVYTPSQPVVPPRVRTKNDEIVEDDNQTDAVVESTIKRALSLINMEEYGRAEAVLNTLIENYPDDSRCWVAMYLCESRDMTNEKPDYDKLKRCILIAKRRSNGRLDSDFEAKADAYVKKLADKSWKDEKKNLLTIAERLKEQINNNNAKLLQVTNNEEKQLDSVEETNSEIASYRRSIARCRVCNAIARILRLFALILLVYAGIIFSFDRKIGLIVENENVSAWASTIRDYLHQYLMQYIMPVMEKYFPEGMYSCLMIVIVAAALLLISLFFRVSKNKARIKNCKKSLKRSVSNRDIEVNSIRMESNSRREPYKRNIEKYSNMYKEVYEYVAANAGAAYWLDNIGVRLGYKDRVDEHLEAKRNKMLEKLN